MDCDKCGTATRELTEDDESLLYNEYNSEEIQYHCEKCDLYYILCYKCKGKLYLLGYPDYELLNKLYSDDDDGAEIDYPHKNVVDVAHEKQYGLNYYKPVKGQEMMTDFLYG
jgi:hypothetical protein